MKIETYEVYTAVYSKIVQAEGVLTAAAIHYQDSQDEIIAIEKAGFNKPPQKMEEDLVEFYRWALSDMMGYQQHTPESRVEKYLNRKEGK
jgi:hypothetical protein